MELSTRRDKSSLGFDYAAYYLPGTTGPKDVKKPNTTWKKGCADLVQYMNDVFLPLQERDMQNSTSRLIYQKRGNAGLANQIAGVCDTLVLGVVYNRVVQSRFRSQPSHVVNAPALPNHFFHFPLFNFTFPATLTYPSGTFSPLSSRAEEARLSLATNIANDSLTFIECSPRSSVQGITDSYNFNDVYKGTVVLETGTTILKQIFKNPRVRSRTRQTFDRENNATVIRDAWYSNCFHSVFQPSAFTLQFIQPWLDLFKTHYVVGMHVRLAGNYTSWREKSPHLSRERLNEGFARIEEVLRKEKDALLFLTTDNKVIEKEVLDRFGTQVVFVGNLPRMHTGLYTNEAALMRSFTELYLLGQCDVLFLTERCMYSKLAAAIRKADTPVYYF